MEIREPKFKAGERVIDKNGDVSTVINVNHYYFDKDEYWYNTEKDETIRLKPESNLESYQENPKTVWDLEKGDTFYVIDSDGDVMKGTWVGNRFENNCRKREIGNIFLTKEEALFEAERRKVEAEMLRLGGTRKINDLNKDIVYTIEIHFGLKYVYVRSFNSEQAPIGTIFFNDRDRAREALQTIGEDRIKKYIFGVE